MGDYMKEIAFFGESSLLLNYFQTLMGERSAPDEYMINFKKKKPENISKQL